MLRGVSLAPQQRFVKDSQDLPTELVNSIIGVTALAPADYGATGSASPLSTAGQQYNSNGGRGGSGGGGAAPGATPPPASFVTRLFRTARRRYQTSVNGRVPVFDANGNLTTNQTGVNMFRFRSLSLFYFFRAQPWTALITYSILMYLLIVLFITVVYYFWGMYCGAGLNMVASIYFTVVSLAANGGYLGEDEDTMTDSTHMCYRGRTVIVMVCSYVNIVFVGLVAALVVGKAEYTGKLGHRVVFSNFCTLATIPGRVGQYRLNFRMANVDNNIPLAHGQLRLFCVTSEPLREYRMRQKQLHFLKNSAPPKSLVRTMYGSAQQLLPGGEATSANRGSTPPAQLTEAMLEGRRAGHHKSHTSNARTPPPPEVAATAAASLIPPRSSSGLEKDAQMTRAQKPRRHNPHSRNRKGANAAAVAKDAGGGSRVHRGRRRVGLEDVKERQRKPHSDNNDDDNDDAGSGRSSPPSSSTATRTSTPSSSSSTTASSAASSRASSPDSETRKTKSGSPPAGRTTAAAALATTTTTAKVHAAASDVTNSSMTSKQNSELYAASPNGGMAGSFAGPAAGKRALSPASMAAAAAVQRGAGVSNSGNGAGDGVRVPDDDDDHEMERVHLRVQELRWTCAEETYLDHGDSGQLSLWYPATITHTIDERSPLYTFMQQPFLAASLKDGPPMALGSARSDDSSVHPPSLRTGPDAARHRFQLVVVFDATEMESGSTITAKHTYTTVDIVAHYKFSDRLVHMQPESGEVMLDFHYFNALLPVDLVELSTTDSEM